MYSPRNINLSKNTGKSLSVEAKNLFKRSPISRSLAAQENTYKPRPFLQFFGKNSKNIYAQGDNSNSVQNQRG